MSTRQITEDLGLYFVEGNVDAYKKAFEFFCRGASGVILRPFNKIAMDFYYKVSALNPDISFYALKTEIEEVVPQGITVLDCLKKVAVNMLFHNDADSLSNVLMEYVDFENGCIIAAKTSHYYLNRPLYVITIPKSGTHLLFELLGIFGFEKNTKPSEQAENGKYNFLIGDNPHTPAEIFLSTIRWDSQEGRGHPFFKSPVIFMYRNPLDILVSEKDYLTNFHKSSMAYYFSTLDDSIVIRELLKSNLIASIHTRMACYAPWLNFPNVIPLSYEELVGPRGNSSLDEQIRCIWSLQLKLHVPGKPFVYGSNIYNPQSPTFSKGIIGRFKGHFLKDDYEFLGKLNTLSGYNIMEIYGYNFGDRFSKFTHRFRRRPVKIVPPPAIKQADTENLFVSKELPMDYTKTNGYRIYYLRGKYYALHPFLGIEIPLNGIDPDEFKEILSGKTLEDLISNIQEFGANNEPLLEESWEDYNFVIYNFKCYAIPQALGTLDVREVKVNEMPGIIVTDSVNEAKNIILQRRVAAKTLQCE